MANQPVDQGKRRFLVAATTVVGGTAAAAVAVPFVSSMMPSERAKAAGVTQVAFDRSGFKYHGRVKALADAAREAGLEF